MNFSPSCGEIRQMWMIWRPCKVVPSLLESQPLTFPRSSGIPRRFFLHTHYKNLSSRQRNAVIVISCTTRARKRSKFTHTSNFWSPFTLIESSVVTGFISHHENSLRNYIRWGGRRNFSIFVLCSEIAKIIKIRTYLGFYSSLWMLCNILFMIFFFFETSSRWFKSQTVLNLNSFHT